jgi:hypothetical protein
LDMYEGRDMTDRILHHITQHIIHLLFIFLLFYISVVNIVPLMGKYVD